MDANTSSALSPQPPGVTFFLRHLADPGSTDGALGFTYASKIIIQSTAWPAESFLAFLTRDLAKQHNTRILEQAQQRLLANDFSPFSFSLTASSGEPVVFLALPRPVGGEDGICISLVAQSTPAQSGRLSSIIDPDSPILRLLDVLPAYVLIIDKDHSVLFANRVARQLFGSIEGKGCHLLLKNLAAPCQNCPPFAIFSTNTVKVHDWLHARSNSAFRVHSYPFETANGSRQVLQIGINITAKVRAQNALDLSEQRYRSIAENLTMGLVLIDPSFNTITLNPKMEEWFGPGAIKGVRLDKFFMEYGKEAGTEAARLLANAVSERQNQDGEFSLQMQTGERHFRLIACPILTRSKIVRAVVVMLEDITDSRDMAQRIQQMQRLEALGSLAGGIAHEINQPLSALHLYAGGLLMMLESGVDTPPDRLMERLSLSFPRRRKYARSSTICAHW